MHAHTADALQHMAFKQYFFVLYYPLSFRSLLVFFLLKQTENHIHILDLIIIQLQRKLLFISKQIYQLFLYLHFKSSRKPPIFLNKNFTSCCSAEFRSSWLLDKKICYFSQIFLIQTVLFGKANGSRIFRENYIWIISNTKRLPFL